MTDNLLDDDDIDFKDIKFPQINPTEIKNNFEKYTSQKLCDIIVSGRYLKINKELSIYCMEELAKRRIAGDEFDFESYIETSYKDLPVIEASINLSDIIQKFSGNFNK